MKKILVLGGLASIGYAFYYYFKKQVELVMNFDYKIKDAKILNLTKDGAKLDVSVQVTNKSSLGVNVLGYDLTFKYKGVELGKTQSNQSFTVNPDSSFIVQSLGDVSFKNAKTVLLPFVKDIINRKPIQIEIQGFLNVEFSGLNRKIEFNNQKITYSKDLLVDVGLDDEFEKGKTKLDNILGKIGIKI
ncbi:LEA type 2 family protein [Candidatus Woesearchaeota archaeon]|nr:LEA type 2 family protein [Candidatus Woesearchaeota archaeon]